MRKSGRVIIVTGGAQGIGKGLVSHFTRSGCQVFFVDVDEAAGRETAQECAGSHFINGDVSDSTTAERAIQECLTRFERIDGLVNNAGLSRCMPLDAITLDEFRRILEVNLVSYFIWAKACAPALRAAKGAVVNIASTRALQSEPHWEAYAASKGGVVALTHALAVTLGPDVRVNAISPGWIETGPFQRSDRQREVVHSDADRDQHPAGRVGTVQDIAHLADYLLGDKSGFVTGQNFVVDGGMTKRMIYV